MEILNLAGPAYDFGAVTFAVLQECEHKRRGLVADQADLKLMAIAREKLAEVEEGYREAGGTSVYWKTLQKEVLETALPQYVESALEQNRLERNSYDVWRKGDPAARALFSLGGLVVGALIVAAPFIPIVEDAFAFFLALSCFFYPELKRLYFEYRHTRLLNRLVVQAEKYQHDPRIHISSARVDEELRAAMELPAIEPLGPRRVEAGTETGIEPHIEPQIEPQIGTTEEGPPPAHPEAHGKHRGRHRG
jgi:hypothetical protein